MLNLFQHLTKSWTYETLKQVQGDRLGLFTSPSMLKNLNLKPRQGFLDFVSELGKWRWRKGDEEDEKSDPSHQLSFSIQGGLII